METLVLRVSELIALVNQTLEYAYPSVVVEGEISSFKVSKGKFVFFDLKDEESVVSCFMMVYQMRTPLEDGMKVKVVANPKLTAWGKFSLTVREVAPVGEGSIKRSFQLLKAKLEKEGLFDAGRKRRLPAIPERIAVISSVEAAGYADFIKILNGRWGGVDVTVANVGVQGAGASVQIVEALQHFNEQADPVDVIVLVRGGGSADDLAVWSDEPLVRAIAASRIPTLVGVGHEVDTSLADLAADVRAATPSNAAQILVPDRDALIRELHHKQQRMLTRLGARRERTLQRTEASVERMLSRLTATLTARQRHVTYARQTLRQLDPKVVLARGYALIRDDKQVIVKDPRKLKPGTSIAIETTNAIINAGVTNVQPKEK
ncbi:MAG TPA: exodeoxyribonuclease VII large subunit [Candidatus Saccharimonadales bacterium]|nr:exodeoxyribonuclease VII large subunit [Candidatus Saccharimonadales bacterium]